MNQLAVGVHFDWRRVDRTVFNRLKRNLRTQRVDPTVAFLTPDLGFVSGFAPAATTSRRTFRSDLERILRTAERRQAKRAGPRVGAATAEIRGAGGRSTSSVRETPAPSQPRVTASATRPSPRARPRPQARRPITSTPRRFRWYRDIRAAQRAAREQGKFLFIASTRPGCHLCENLVTRTVPQVEQDILRVAIPYRYNISRPESGRVDRVVRGMNRGARLMPLCGFVTADLRPIRGFSGPTSAAQLRAYLADASRRAR